MKFSYLKFITFLVFIIVVFLFYIYGGKNYFELSFLQERLVDIQYYTQQYPYKSFSIFFLIYVIATALSFPGASILTLLSGAIFGMWTGLVLSSFASSIGSLLAFLASRFFLRDFFLKKFNRQFRTIDENIKKDGIFYLSTLRLIPIFPFFVINIVIGLTNIHAYPFYWVSQLSMLPATAVFVYAGREFSELSSLSGILSPGMLWALTLLAALPFIGKLLVNMIKQRQAYKGYKKPKRFDYNLIVIGGGSAGLVAAYIAATVKAKVALIEKQKMGGDCLNTGCVPSKALIKTAKVVHFNKRASEFGLTEVNVKFSFSQVMERVQRVITDIAPHDSVARYKDLGVECINGKAKIIDPWTVEVAGKKITSKKIIIATGARPAVPELPGLDQASFVTSENLWDIRELPQKFVIIGGGPIGIEMAQAFSRLGSEVTVIEAGERILSKEDPVVSQRITDTLVKEGIKLLTSHRVKSFTNSDGGKRVVCDSAGGEIEIDYHLVLLAIGRKPHIKGFGLAELGVKLRSDGTIDVNSHMQSSIPNIYACGDVTGPYQLTHMASHQAWYCTVNSLSPKKFKIAYSTVPWCTYTDPEVATVGETQMSAKEKNLAFDVTEYDLSDLDRAIAEDEKNGVVRVITEKGKDKILGATIVGSQASSMIVEYVAAMKNKKGLNSILATIHVYPSFGEANKYAAGNWKRSQVNPRILPLLTKYFNWTRK